MSQPLNRDEGTSQLGLVALGVGIVESAPDAVVSLSFDGRVESWSWGATQMFGYDAEEMVGQSIQRIISAESVPLEAAVHARLRAEGSPEVYESVRLTRAGQSLPVSVHAWRLADGAGGFVVAEIARDISEQKRLEQELRLEATLLDGLSRSGEAIFSATDLEQLVRIVTDAATELSGAGFGAFFYDLEGEASQNSKLYPSSAAARQAFAHFLLPHHTSILGHTFAGEVVCSDDIVSDVRYAPHERAPGAALGEVPLRSYLGVPVLSRSGTVLAALFLGHAQPGRFCERIQRFAVALARQAGMAIENSRQSRQRETELSELRRSEAALRQPHSVYRAIGEAIDYGTWICDATGRNIYASPSFLELVGMSQEQCSEFGWGAALHPDDAEPTLAAWQACVRTGAPWEMDHRYLGVDGRYHPILARGIAVRDEQGAVTCWAGINLDVSRLKRAEAALREADRRKDEFLAVLAHELRNPLAPIRYALAIAKQPGRSPEQKRHTEAIIERQVEHMSRLLEDLLDISRITHGALELRKAPIELGSAIGAAVEAARPMLDEKQHTLEVDLPSQVVTLEADPVRIAQIFSNLLINAAKYTDAGGRIRLSAQLSGEQVLISVRDNGIGISPDMKPRLFTAFSQTRPALERVEGGLGIGLSLVHGLVKLHGGTIDAHSDGRMQGSEFVVRLPLGLPSSAQPVADSPSEHASARKLRVLVADDNADNAEVSGTLLELWGHEVHVAHTGHAALTLAESQRPAVLLLDIGMPDLNGYDVAAAIRAAPWGQEMILIAVTGWGRDEDRLRSQSVGFNHHLTKPVDPTKLRLLLSGL
jgi:PAS domain S-box-containing protein